MFTQITDRFSRFASEHLSVSHLKSSLQEWIRNEIVDDDPYALQETLFNLSEVKRKNNRRERLINFQTKVFTLIDTSESVKAVVIKELKVLQAYNRIMSSKRAYH